jgi:hypothetical protein
MAQSETTAGEVGNTADSNPADPFMDIAAEMLGEEEQPEEALEDEGEQPEAEEGEESEDVTEDEAEDDDLPPIDPPVSWTAEEKAAFAALPRDLQETVQKREADRERFVQTKAQEAARARHETEQAAHQQLAQIERTYAQQYQEIAARFDVPEPDMALLATNPTEYAMQAHQYRQAQAQREQAQQTAAYYAQQAEQREAQAEQVQRAQEHQFVAEHFPEYLDPTTGPKLQQELTGVAKEMGYPPELIAEARATDIIAMRKAAEWKAKADKLDRLEAKKMEKVRSAKGLPRVATPGVAVGAEQTRQVRATAAFERAKSAKSIGDRADAFGEWAAANGLL